MASLQGNASSNGAIKGSVNTGKEAWIKGLDGNGIAKVEQIVSEEDGGINEIIFTFDDGTQETFEVRNGNKGSDGKDGKDGVNGDKGDNGTDANVTKANIASALGYTPADQTKVSEISKQIADQQTELDEYESLTLGVHTDGNIYIFKSGSPIGNGLEIKAEEVVGDVIGYIDENNNIVLSGALAEDTYTVKYEMEDGSVLTVGTLSLVTAPTYTNLAGTITVGRLGSDGTIRSDAPGCRVTDYVEVKNGDVVYVKGIDFSSTPTYPSAVYDSSKTKLSSVALSNGSNSYYTVEETTLTGARIKIISDSVGYVRFSGVPNGADEDIIVTVNEPIE